MHQAHHAVRSAAQVLGAAGAVVAVAELLRHVPPGQALVWLVALGTIGHAVVGVWMATTGPLRPGELARAGARATALLLIGTLALTDVLLFVQLLAVLASSTLLGVGLGRAAAATGQPGAGQPQATVGMGTSAADLRELSARGRPRGPRGRGSGAAG